MQGIQCLISRTTLQQALAMQLDHLVGDSLEGRYGTAEVLTHDWLSPQSMACVCCVVNIIGVLILACHMTF